MSKEMGDVEFREVVRRIADREWIVATAFNGEDFGWVVNVIAGKPRNGSQHYRQAMETFAATPADAALLGLTLLPASHAD